MTLSLQREEWAISLEKNSFIKRDGIILFGNLLIAAVWAVVGILYNINPEFLFYEISFILMITAVILIIRYIRFKKDAANAPVISDDEASRKAYEELKNKEDFFSMWAHQIKTPIAAMNLLLQNEEYDQAGCRQELFRIENYVEMALNYSRFENMSGDLVLEKCRLLQMVKQSVKKYSQVFIHKHLKVELDVHDITILTDEKWFCFVLEQILSNALKYTKEGCIRISAGSEGRKVCISISDTGIGIRKEDLPRIFEKGYTGYNGRLDKKASGLGLYLCSGICKKLGHEISAVSEEGRGTEIKICVPEDIDQGNLTKM